MTNHLFDGLLAAADPSRQFAEIPGENGTKTRWYSYKDVDRVSAMMANRLVALGVQPGDRVAAQVPKSLEAIMLYLGTVRVGGVFLPLNTAYTPRELTDFLQDAEPRLFVCDPKDAEALCSVADAADARLESLGVWTHPGCDAGTLADETLEMPETFETVPRKSEDLAAILYTSGTTGRSKGVMLTHDNLLSNARTLAEAWRFTAEDRLLHALPIFHTHGLFVATNITLVAGGGLIFLNRFDADQLLDHMPKATALMGVPTFYTRLLASERLTREVVAHMRLFVSGSAPLLPQTHQEFEERTGHAVLERYGMTETNMNTTNPYEGPRRAGTVGKPLPDVELRVCTLDGQPVAQGDTGVIEVKGPNVFAGYWRMPDKTKEEFRDDGFFITGDLGFIDADGYVTISGRAKDLIISGGYNIYPKEIELLLDAQPTVSESAVIGVPHKDMGEAVVAVVVPNGSDVGTDDLLNAIAPDLARYKQPRRIVMMDTLPRNTMGKVQKTVLRDQFSGLFD